MVRIDEKTLSVNGAWKGRRYKSDAYKAYRTKLLYLLPHKINIPQPPFEIYFRFGFSSAASDWDNPVKPLQDILAEKYGFNDKLIRRAIVDTEIVPKGKEFFEFELKTFIPINKVVNDFLLDIKKNDMIELPLINRTIAGLHEF